VLECPGHNRVRRWRACSKPSVHVKVTQYRTSNQRAKSASVWSASSPSVSADHLSGPVGSHGAGQAPPVTFLTSVLLSTMLFDYHNNGIWEARYLGHCSGMTVSNMQMIGPQMVLLEVSALREVTWG
jgi:hypothetical protein